MRTEVRFLLAIGLMLLVLVGTNVLFPPVRVDPPAVPEVGEVDPSAPGVGLPDVGVPARPDGTVDAPVDGIAPVEPPRRVTVRSPLHQHEFTTLGAQLLSAQLPRFRSMRVEEEYVELIPEGRSALASRVVVAGRDTVDLSTAPFEVSPRDGFVLEAGDAPQTLTFTYQHPNGGFAFEVAYTYTPDTYLVEAVGRVRGAERPLVLTDLGHGLGYNEADSTAEAQMMAYVGNHLNDGIRSQPLSKVDAVRLINGPFLWSAFRSKFFVMAVLPGTGLEQEYLGGMIVDPGRVGEPASVAVSQALRADGSFRYRLFLGPQDYAELTALGNDLEEVNPYGWKFFRPIVRPFVAIIITVLTFLHNTLGWGYGWVLVLFGVMMRVLLWPLNQKAMRAQMRNMAVQPMVKEIQTKYKDNPERMQKEMLRLYKEYGFNPMAGCLPMLLPWPILIALFFVFQNTIEFRGVPFLWLPDLSAADPFYILPVILAASMFLLQYISYKSMGQDNPQMKMMMWFFPIFFGFLFMRFAAGLNLYYAVSNLVTIPQQYWIAKERKKAQAVGPVKLADRK